VRFDSFAAFVRFCLKISRIFPCKISAVFLQYISERPADFAKATTAKEMAEGQNDQQKEIKI
jgi:hypothetical protein